MLDRQPGQPRHRKLRLDRDMAVRATHSRYRHALAAIRAFLLYCWPLAGFVHKIVNEYGVYSSTNQHKNRFRIHFIKFGHDCWITFALRFILTSWARGS
jgi:hypothetical protein